MTAAVGEVMSVGSARKIDPPQAIKSLSSQAPAHVKRTHKVLSLQTG